MKRIRDDVHANSQFKRPFGSSRGESYGQSPIPGGGGVVGGEATQKLTTNDALTYLKEVKDMFQDQRDKYDMFLDVMKDFKAQRVDTTGVIARVKELFKGHNNLILGFNTFLPKGYEITLADEQEALLKRTVEFDEAISFVNKIKKRFQNDDHVYKSFLDILNMYRKDHKGITEVYHEVATLFMEHPDLLDEFKRFLPDSSATAAAPQIPFAQHSFHRAPPEKQRRRDRILAPHTHRDLSVERNNMDEDKTIIKMQKDQRKRAEKDNMERRSRDQDSREPEPDLYGDVNMESLHDKKESGQKIEDFGVNPVLGSDDKDALRIMYKREFIFCEKVKERLHSSEDYQTFLKCLHIYSTSIISRKDLEGLVGDLLGKYPDLMAGFSEFLERCENIDGFLAGVMNKKSLWSDGHASKSTNIDGKDKEQKRETDGAKEKDRCKEKYMGKSIQELDLSSCRCCTPSYRLLPEDYPITSASQRSELGAQVLNDNWVSVTSGSEDYSFKHMRRNQYEESLFRCEDDRFELDMVLESVSSTAKQAEELLNSITNNTISSEGAVCVEDHFTALNLRCIERLYGDHGLDVVDLLRKNPSVALPVILIRLKQKQEEWTMCRSDFNKVWAEIYAKNHYKSLDHRSFYFKQQDSKDLNTKSLVAEIKDMKEKTQKVDDVVLAIAVASRHPTIPNLEFEYSDTDIHEDLYKLIKYSCEEVCTTKDQLNKVMRLWTCFLEPMLGVSSRHRNAEGIEDVGKARHHGGKSTKALTGEGNGTKPICNGDERSLPDLAKISLASVDTLAKDHDFHREEVQKIKTAVDKVSGFDVTAGSGEQVLSVAADNNEAREFTSGQTNPPGPSQAAVEDINLGKSKIDEHSLEGGNFFKPVPLANGALVKDSKFHIYYKESIQPSKIEKEEGELSPNGGDFEEDNFFVYGDGSSQAVPNAKHGAETNRMQYQAGNGGEVCCQDPGGENDVDTDDEDSGNVSEADDVSGSESAADECSREEHEEDEDREQYDIDDKNGSESEGIPDSRLVRDGISPPPSENFLRTVKPLAKHVTSVFHHNDKRDSRVFYGNDTFYVLFRLLQILYERLLSAKLNSTATEMRSRTAKDGSPSDPYGRFMSALYNLLDGSADNAKFEDDCRAIIGNQSYVLFTLDKLIYKLVKQLQIVSSDETDNKLLQLYEYEETRTRDDFVDSVYYDNVHVILHDENIYRFAFLSGPSRLSILLMDDGKDKAETVAVSVDPNFANYLHNDFLPVLPNKRDPSGIFMHRNKCKYAEFDETSAICKAMEGVCVVNGLECKMACSSSKISYVLDTEDFFLRLKRRKNSTGGRSSCHDQGRVNHFHKFLTALQ